MRKFLQSGGSDGYVVDSAGLGSFPLVADRAAATLVVSSTDHPGVLRVVGDLRDDIRRVTGVEPAMSVDQIPARGEVVLIGTIGTSPIINAVVDAGKLDVCGIAGRWETSLEQVVTDPLPGLGRAFVIAGSDQRGTIFGAYDVSKQIGVSPWYWWDDVPVRHRPELHVRPGRHTQGTPAVKYRGFFINDENPNLGTWAPGYFGPGHAPGYPSGFNHRFWAKVFETMLRLKANYLWPAVWGRAFAEDDPINHATASAYGVVIGTSHEAPMMRGIEEWNRHAVPAVRDANGDIRTPGQDPCGGTGEWSLRRNRGAIEAYFAEGIARMVDEDIEGVVTLGMRGNGDVSLPDGDGIDLMREIIATQRRIIARVTGREATAVPQAWTLYKEVQRYWDKGLRVPDDVTVIFTDDNWGNLRKLPDPSLPAREGGYGMYYHFDYVGGGRNYKWVDTTNLASAWEQLNAAYRYGVDRLWVVNVGDLKSEELPLQMFLDYAWDPDALPIEKLGDWQRRFAAQNFPPELAGEIAEVLHEYGTLQSRRKPELLNRRITVDSATGAIHFDDQGDPFYLEHYREHERVTEQWHRLAERAELIAGRLPAAYSDAYFQLVHYQVRATANLYALRLAEFTNILYARQGRAATNSLAALAEARLADDLALAEHWNTAVADGKWKNFQLQPHIGYGDVARYGPNAYWQQPEIDNVALPDVIFPPVRRVRVPEVADMGVAVDGSTRYWLGTSRRPEQPPTAPGQPTAPELAVLPDPAQQAVLPEFSPYQSQPAQYLEVFNRGSIPFDYSISSPVPWLIVTPDAGRVDPQVRATLRVDWSRAPAGTTRVPVTVHGPGDSTVVVWAIVHNVRLPSGSTGFVAANGYVSINADHFDRAVAGAGISWLRLPDAGRTGAGMTPFPVTAPSQRPGEDSPRLEYALNLFTTGSVTVWAYLSPRNNALPTDGLRYAISLDDAQPQVVDIIAATGADDTAMNRQWACNTSDNVNRTATTHTVSTAGRHVLKFWMVDPTVVLQNLIVDTGGLRPSYLGPPESTRLT